MEKNFPRSAKSLIDSLKSILILSKNVNWNVIKDIVSFGRSGKPEEKFRGITNLQFCNFGESFRRKAIYSRRLKVRRL